MALVGVELETLVSEPDALTIRPPPCAVLVSSSSLVTKFFVKRLLVVNICYVVQPPDET